jgi:iron-sulfur cluster repair protein YtfE (RIC family)
MMKTTVKTNLVQLGGAPRQAETLRDLLMECHGRIRHFSRLALTIAARPELAADEVKEGAAQCLRYFTQALPLHVRDEEDSIAPRLAGQSAGLDATLAQMRAQHFEHETKVERLINSLEAVIQKPNTANRRQLALISATLETDFEAHLRLEELQILPLLDKLLKPAVQSEIIKELRARRMP